jgi:diguanylate cyclase (GGDEF)-like protein
MILASLAIAPLIVDRVRDVAADRAERIEDAHRQAQALASRGVDEQDELLATTRAFLQVVGHSYPTFLGSRAACNAFQSKLAAGLLWARAVSVIDRNGTVICSSNPESIGHDVSDRAHFKHAMQTGEFVIGDYQFGRRLAGPNIIAMLPQRGGDGSVEIVAASVMDVNWIARLGTAVTERSGAVMLMVDGAGTVITRHPNPETWIGQSFRDHPLVRTILADSQGTVTANGLDGVHRIFGFVQLPGTEVRLAVGLDEREVLRRVNNAMWVSYGYLAAISAMVLGGIWLGGERLFAKPLRDLAGMAARVGRGERPARTQESAWAAEFVPLTTALDDMAGEIAERERGLVSAKDRLEELAQLDPLTKLANRRAFDSRLHAEWERGAALGHPVSLLMIDVDHFKPFNDRYGHVAGDECLQAVGNTLASTARTRTDISARYGGEEFVILLPRAGLEIGIEVAERVRKAVEALNIVHCDAAAGRVTVSIGIASFVPMAGDARQLVKAADAALYSAKRQGRNTVATHSAMVLAEAS